MADASTTNGSVTPPPATDESFGVLGEIARARKEAENDPFLSPGEEYSRSFNEPRENARQEEEESPEEDGAQADGVRNFISQAERNISQLDTKIKQITKETKPITSELRRLNTELTFLRASLLAARPADALKTISHYLRISAEVWWWTIVGAIIDFLVVTPIIFIIFLLGLKKGAVGKRIEKKIKDVKDRIKKTQEKIRTEELTKRQLYQQRNALQSQEQAMLDQAEGGE